jgi:hypothetical protein
MLTAAIKAIIAAIMAWVADFVAGWIQSEKENSADESQNKLAKEALEKANTQEERDAAAKKISDNW